jgi:hypothetical protein
MCLQLTNLPTGGALRVAASSNPSLEPTRYGRHCKPGLSQWNYRLSPGLQYLPTRAAQLERYTSLAHQESFTMNFGTPTPAFYQIVSVLALAFVVTTLGFNAFLAFFLGLFTAYILFIASLGGFSRSNHFAMAAGWGILVMIPTSFGCALAVGAGALVRKVWRNSRDAGSQAVKPDETV